MAAARGETVSAAVRIGIEAISDAQGGIRVLAIDHRDSMRRFLAPDDPSVIGGDDITQLKVDIVGALIDQVTGVMLEPEFSIPQVTAAGLVPQGVGVIAALEAQGYLDDPSSAVTSVLDGWSIEQARDHGASMVKLLLPYRPDSPLAAAQEQVARRVVADSRRLGLPLVLEPLPWGVDDPDEHARVVVSIIRTFAALEPGLLKVPFPGRGQTSATVAERSCREIAAACSMPWAVLSGGGTFEAFEHQLTMAVGAGSAGFMVGRALWGEAASAPVGERAHILTDLVRPRLARLNRVVTRRG